MLKENRHQVKQNFIMQPLLETLPDLKQQQIHPKFKRYLTLFIIFVILIYRYCRHKNQVDCIIDIVHIWTAGINKKFHQSYNVGYFFQIIAQLSIDIQLIAMAYFTCVKLKKFQIPTFMILFYGIRAILLNTVKFPFPADIFWQQPPLPSIGVPYARTRDFFYSGHTGFMTYCILIWDYYKWQNMKRFSQIGIIFVVFLIVVTRVHYSIDIWGGYTTAHFLFKWHWKVIPLIDYILSQPYYLMQFIKKRYFI